MLQYMREWYVNDYKTGRNICVSGTKIVTKQTAIYA